MSQPGFFFYVGDYIKDTRALTLEARGAWMDMLCVLFDNGGEITWPMTDIATFWGVHVDKCDAIVRDLSRLKIANVTVGVTGLVTIVSRRMKRDAEARENNKIRKRKERDRKTRHRSGHASVTAKSSASSSSESSSSSLLSQKSTPSAAPEKSKTREFEPLVKLAASLGSTQEDKRRLCQWTISMISTLRQEPEDRTRAVVAACLENVRRKIEKGYTITNLWGLLTKIFDDERTKHIQGAENEANKNIPIHESVKKFLVGIG